MGLYRDVALHRRAQVVVLLQHRPQDLVPSVTTMRSIASCVACIASGALSSSSSFFISPRASQNGLALAIGYVREVAIIGATLHTRDRSG